jgi:hypothetical protein
VGPEVKHRSCAKRVTSLSRHFSTGELGFEPTVYHHLSRGRSCGCPGGGNSRLPVLEATATLDWRLPPVGPGQLMLFEAFVTDQRKTTDARHVEDAHLAIEAFQRGTREPASFESSVEGMR